MSYRVRLRWSVTAAALPLFHILLPSRTVCLNNKEPSVTGQATFKPGFSNEKNLMLLLMMMYLPPLINDVVKLDTSYVDLLRMRFS
jgi:hypothetical protein